MRRFASVFISLALLVLSTLDVLHVTPSPDVPGRIQISITLDLRTPE